MMMVLPVPDVVRAIAPDDPATTIFSHEFSEPEIKITWFRERLVEIGLPGRVDTVLGTDGKDCITRGSLFELARTESATNSDEELLSLFWSVMCWGAGNNVRNMPRIMLPFAVPEERGKRIAALRRSAALVSESRHGEAFAHLKGEGRIKHLNASFFTKWLYFTGGGAPDHEALILDDRVLASLRATGWASIPAHGLQVKSAQYVAYVDLVQRWARELSEGWERVVRPDEIEKALWQAAGQVTR